MTVDLGDELREFIESLIESGDYRTQSEVIRSLIENGSVRERITQEHIHIIRQLIGESTNLNQLARQANTYGFFAVADRCKEMAQHINLLIKRLKDDR